MKRRKFLGSAVALCAVTFISTKGFALGGGMFGFGKNEDGGAGTSFPYRLTDQEWKDKLSDQAYDVLRDHGTERSASSPLDKIYEAGTYHCMGCDQKLFSSKHKFDSGTGWPSFYQPIDGVQSALVGTREDNKLWMKRTEVHCANCGGHQGHVFPDGPEPTRLRYCINGAAMRFDGG